MVGAAILACASLAEAQYFGQNKVQYEKFDFKVLKTDHFDIYYYPEEEPGVRLAARMAERWYTRLSRVLGHQLSSRQPLILYAAHPHFQQTNVLDGAIGEGTGGVTESAKRRIVLPFAGGLAETDHVVGHELVHAFQYDIAAVGAGGRGMELLPLWFIEGMAEYLSLGPVDAHTAMWVRDAASRDGMPTISKLDDPNFFPYRYGHAFWAYVAGRWGDPAVGDMFKSASRSGNVQESIRNILGVEEKELTEAWHRETAQAYRPFFEGAQAPSAFGRPLVTRESGGGRLNMSPSISPDGRKLVFLSERSEFAIEMYVADVATGKITKTLVKTAGDGHFESLQFIESAGDWSPDSKRFVFAALSKGQPVLTIVDTDKGDRLAEHEFKDLDQVFNPAWSPDGNRIAFSAMKGGVLDLFAFDLTTKQLTRLTDDAYADYDPEWAPNGRELAWVTDRFTTNLDLLEYGGYRIGLLDVEAKTARPLAGFPTGRNTNPEFSPDGDLLFFIGTPDGIPNVYRQNLASGAVVALTNVVSGVSGITQLTPALSVASKADNVVFTLFENDEYNNYAIEGGTQIPGRPVPGTERNGALLPPSNRPSGEVFRYLATASFGLPATTDPSVNPDVSAAAYEPKLGLDIITQPTAGVGVDRWGVYGAGSLAMIFSDALGNHQFGTYFQISSRFSEFGAGATYLNKTHRWNWGLNVEQMPYVSSYLETGILNGAYAEREVRYTQINQMVQGILQYPFSRAHRVEFTGGFRRISFKQQTETYYYDPFTLQQIGHVEEDFDTAPPLNIVEAGTALVYDTSVFGATSPIIGQRYRLEYQQSAGSLRYSGVLADYRKYIMPVRPFTIAFRGMTYGRYGPDSENQTYISPINIGYPGLIRGYDPYSIEPQECPPFSATCPLYDSLYGSRMALASVELRFPVFGIFSGKSFYGPLPIEGIVFADAGVAWWSNDLPSFAGGNRDGLRSVGTGIRFNALGFLVGEVDFVRPIDRPERGWMWQFSFVPGF
jgi:Tol biopolymer transport system component